MNATNNFAGISTFDASNYYSAAGLRGLAGGFGVYAVGLFQSALFTGSNKGHILGCYDAASNAGYRLYCDATGVHAVVGDGAASVTIDSGKVLDGHYALVQLSVFPLGGGHTIVALGVNGVGVDFDNSLTNAYAPFSSGVCSIGYDVNAGADPNTSMILCGFGFIANATTQLSTNPQVLFNEGVVNTPGGAVDRELGKLLNTSSNVLTSWRAIYDNDGTHPPVASPLQSAAAAWKPYMGDTTPVFNRTGTGLIVGNVSAPWF